MVMRDGDGNGKGKGKKTSKGRRKIEIKEIKETNSRQVTFSKRRVGLFKKASEVCVLTGVQVAFLVSSPGGRVYAFGHPNADLLVDGYLNHKTEKPPPPLSVSVKERILGSAWYEEDIVDGMEVEKYISSVEELKEKLLRRADEVMMMKTHQDVLAKTKELFEMTEDWNSNLDGTTALSAMMEELAAVLMKTDESPALLEEWDETAVDILADTGVGYWFNETDA